jgi:two-component system sensor histidine kinase MtrB
MFASFRSRLIATVIVLIGVTAGSVGVVSYLLVRNSLRAQLVDDSVARAEFNIAVLASADLLPSDAGREAFEASGLTDRFLLRGTGGVYVEFSEGEPFASSLSLLAADALLSEELRRVVAGDEYGYQFLTLDETPTLVVAGRRPPAGPDFYFFYPADDVTNALSALSRLLAVAGVGVLVLGALGAGLIARRVLRPVATAGEAAGVMAAGDLSVRLPADTDDELGRLAVSFNQMAISLDGQISALRRAHDRERRFVADVSHELRTPLTALVNEAARLQPSLDSLPDPDRRVGQMLVADVARLRGLVEDLLEISRLDATPTEPDASEVDLVRFLEAVIEERHPAVELSVSDAASAVRIDRPGLERIVGNLLDNARHHASEAPVTVTARIQDGILTVVVADGGPGVAHDALAHLFDRFYKTDEARRGGSGLGLAIARQHARRLGGDLTVRPVSPTGLAFTFTVPVAESLHAGDAAEKSVSEPEGEEKLQSRRTP